MTATRTDSVQDRYLLTIDVIITLVKQKYDLTLTPSQEEEMKQDLLWALEGKTLLSHICSRGRR